MSTKIEPYKCIVCGHHLDRATGLNGADTPSPGAISIRGYCGAASEYEENLSKRLLLPADLAQAEYADVRKVQAKIRQLRGIKEE